MAGRRARDHRARNDAQAGDTGAGGHGHRVAARRHADAAALGLRDTLLIAKQLATVASPMAQPEHDDSQHASSALLRFVSNNEELERMLLESAAEAESMSAALLRSEERRVGKECRSRWS